MIKIEVLRAHKNAIAVAFYFEIPAQLQTASAADPSRKIQGQKLSSAQRQDILDGKVMEVVRSRNFRENLAPVQMRQRLEQMWAEMESEVLERYRDEYRFNGATWDGDP